MMSVFVIKASGYDFLKKHSQHGSPDSFWYSMEQKSKKSTCYVTNGIMSELPFGNQDPGKTYIVNIKHVVPSNRHKTKNSSPKIRYWHQLDFNQNIGQLDQKKPGKAFLQGTFILGILQ